MVGPESESSTPTWECLGALVREKAQEMVQRILEEEVTELLGREKSERRSTVDSAEGYRNGYGKPRRLAMSSGTITLRRPRVRGVEERFESRVLPLFARRTQELGALLPELYLHGLAEGDLELAMRGLLKLETTGPQLPGVICTTLRATDVGVRCIAWWHILSVSQPWAGHPRGGALWRFGRLRRGARLGIRVCSGIAVRAA